MWTAAGLSRSWLPQAIRRELHHQWWASSAVPSAPALRARIAAFWIDVTPWVAGTAGVEPLPTPPLDPALLAEMRGAIERELDRNGTAGLGEDRSTALWRASLQLERMATAQLAS